MDFSLAIEERGAVFSASIDRGKAGIIFEEMKATILRVPEFASRVNIQDYNEFTVRPDFYATQSHHISGRIYFNDFKAPSFSGNGNMIIADRSWTARYGSYGGNWLWTIRPNLLSNLVISYSRLNSFSEPGFETKDGGPVCGACMGMNIAEYPDTPPNLIMWTNGFWAAQNTNYINRHNIALSESISWTKGKHAFKTGFEVRFNSSNGFNGTENPEWNWHGVNIGAGGVAVTGIANIPGLVGTNITTAQNLLLDLSGSVGGVSQTYNIRRPNDSFIPVSRRREYLADEWHGDAGGQRDGQRGRGGRAIPTGRGGRRDGRHDGAV